MWLHCAHVFLGGVQGCQYINYYTKSSKCSVFSTCQLVESAENERPVTVKMTSTSEPPFYMLNIYDVPMGSRMCAPGSRLVQKVTEPNIQSNTFPHLQRMYLISIFSTRRYRSPRSFFHVTSECAAFTTCKVIRPGRDESTIEWINGALVPDDVGGKQVGSFF